MKNLWQLLSAAMVLATLACGGSVGMGAGGSSGGVGVGVGTGKGNPGPVPYTRQISDWHDARIKRLTADDGWLSLVGLFPLPEGTHTFGSAADNELKFPDTTPAHGGSLTVANRVVTLKPAPDVEMTLDDKPVGEIVLAPDTSQDGPAKIQMGSIQFYVIDREDKLYLRVKDANSPVRKNFKGIERFDVSSKWRFEAKLELYDPPKTVAIPNILGYDEVVQVPGVLVFEKDGREFRLEPMSQEGDELFVVFGDATSGDETYGGGRFVYCDAPGPDGKTMLDFNKAYNPPCVFTEFATCPLPHRYNILPFRVEAGEKAWADAAHSSP